MPQMGFDKTLGRDWFRNKAYLEFPWGMDDKAFFEGALGYVKQIRQQKKPWMLTLLTVGTHQPYSAPEEYLARYPDAKKAAIAYLDDAVDAFLTGLEKQGVLRTPWWSSPRTNPMASTRSASPPPGASTWSWPRNRPRCRRSRAACTATST